MKKSITISEKIQKLESRFSEGLYGPADQNTVLNIFNRKVIYAESPEAALGLASTGYRTSIIVENDDSWRLIDLAKEHNLPIVFYLDIRHYNKRNNLFVASLSGAEDVMKFSLLAHKISEKTLTPSILLFNSNSFNEKISDFPDVLSINFLGYPNQLVTCELPAQKLLFGEKRRLIPKWVNIDIPGQFGGIKKGISSYQANASRELFSFSHIKNVCGSTIDDFNKTFQQEISPFQSVDLRKSKDMIITSGIHEEELNIFRDLELETGFLNFSILSPKVWRDDIKTGVKKFITKIHYSTECNEYPNVKTFIKNNDFTCIDAIIDEKLNNENFIKIVMNMRQKSPVEKLFPSAYFKEEDSENPKSIVLTETLNRDYKLPEYSTKRSLQKRKHLPASIKKVLETGPLYTRHNVFLDYTLTDQDNESMLVTSPYLGVPWVPQHASTLLPSATNSAIEIDHTKCSACGDCYAGCPETAIRPLSANITSILQTGQKLAAQSGVKIIKLIPHIKTFARIIDVSEEKSMKDLLQNGFDKLITKLKPDEEVKEILNSEFKAISKEIDSLPVAITERFYHNLESFERGTGEVFSLSVDPEACTQCGLCSAICPEMAVSEKELTENYRNNLMVENRLIEKSPDTSNSTVDHLLNDEKFNPFGALMLKKNLLNKVSGSRKDYPQGKNQLHYALAINSDLKGRKVKELSLNISELIDKLDSNIHKILEDALPKNDYKNLLENLEDSDKKTVATSEILSISASTGKAAINRTVLERKILLLEELKKLYKLTSVGISGEGRPSEVVFATMEKEYSWLNKYPNNPLGVPCYTFKNIAEITGVSEGLKNEIVDNIKIIRRAQLEAFDKYNPSKNDLEIAQLEWKQLTDDEKQWLPTHFLFCSEEYLKTLSDHTLLSLTKNVPLKVLAISNGNYRIQDSTQWLPNELSENLEFFQSGGNNKKVLYKILKKGIGSEKTSVFNLYGASSADEQLLIEQGLLQKTRLVPEISLTHVQSENISLPLIKLEDDTLTNEEDRVMKIKDSETSYTITWSDFAFRLNKFQKEFSEYSGEDSVPVYEYLNGKKGVPCIYNYDGNKTLKYRVSDFLIHSTKIFEENWKSIKVLVSHKGTVPEDQVNSIKEELKEEMLEKIEQVKADYEEKIQNLKSDQFSMAREKLKNNLRKLAQYKKQE